MWRTKRARVLQLAIAIGATVASPPSTPAPAAPADFRMVTGPERGTSIAIGRDLAKYVAPDAGIELDVLPSLGSVENLERLRYELNVKLAIVQSDVYQAFVDYAASGKREAQQLIAPLRVVLPLYDEEVHFLVRADSPLEYVHEIRGRRLAIDRVQSGTALTAATLYRRMFGEPIADGNASFMPTEDALVRLATGRGVDVVVIVAGQPVKLLADMKPEAKGLVRLLKVDPDHPATRAALATYERATIRATSYPAWLSQDVPGFAVKSLLVTYDYTSKPTVDGMTRFATSFCSHFDALRREGHPKWRDVDVTLPALGAGWSYYAPTERALRACATQPTKRASYRAAIDVVPVACAARDQPATSCR